MNTLQVGLFDPAKVVIAQIGQFLINLLLVVLVLLIGWIISKFIKTVVTKLLTVLKTNELSARIELNSILAKGGITASFSELIGTVCYWLGLLVTVVVAVNAGGLTIAADLLSRIVLYIPNVIAAIFILLLGMFFVKMLTNIIKTAVGNSGVGQANMLTKVVEIAVMIFAIVMALEQLNIRAGMIMFVVNIILASFGLGIAIAFGLGCKDIAAKATSDFLASLKTKK